MTEMAFKDAERRGVGINKWIHAQVTFCKYQLDENIKKQNVYLLKEDMCTALYAEIDRILPSLEYRLAPKKAAAPKAASSLRAAQVSQSQTVSTPKPEQELDKHGQILYDWLDNSKPSRVRMLAYWQSAAGLSFVAGVHHRAATCFRYCGNQEHDQGLKTVSLADFQEGIKARHRVGDSGIGAEDMAQAADAVDFAPAGA